MYVKAIQNAEINNRFHPVKIIHRIVDGRYYPLLLFVDLSKRARRKNRWENSSPDGYGNFAA